MKMPAIASALGMSLSTVKRRLMNAQEKLHKLML